MTETTHSESQAQALLAEARRRCAVQGDIVFFNQAAGELLAALTATSEAERRDLCVVIHDFLDLARRKPLRKAAYEADPTGKWIDDVIQLIDRSDFTVGRMFRQRAAEWPDKTLFTVPRGEQVVRYPWRRVAELTRQLAGGLLSVLGERARVALYTPNRIEGALLDLACLTNGIFNAIVPANSVTSQVEQILTESGARMLVVSGAEHLRTALAAITDLPDLEWVVTLDEVPKVPGVHTMSYRELLEHGAAVSTDTLARRLDQVRSRDLATTMYTSGTTGKPKGIKFAHLNLVAKRYARAAALPDIDEHEVFLCYLPLYHTFGRWLEMLGCVHLAAEYVFAESPSTETLITHMKRFKPTAMISVPKKWQDVYTCICPGGEPAEDSTQQRQQLAELTGGRLRWGLSAAGRLDPEVFRFFQRNGIGLLSGYGMTEATGGITMTPPGGYLRDSIGRALPGIELGFGEDNELLLRGPYVTEGYTDPEDTQAAFTDGWLHTGDLVRADDQGFLWHVDRKKDIYKNANGRTVAPQRIEGLFADFPEVARVFAVGDGREYITLLIRPNFDCPDVPLRDMTAEQLREYFRGLVVACNRFLAPFERVVNFALLDRDFSLDREELTFKGSFRRAVVEENFKAVIEPMYAAGAIERQVNGLPIKVPAAFLQQLGATEGGLLASPRGLEFQATNKTLAIHRDPKVHNRVWIGNCCYEIDSNTINLDDWLRRPELWVGNADLTHVTGESILVWSLAAAERTASARMLGVEPPRQPVNVWRDRLESAGGASSLLTVHAAAVVLSTGLGESASAAVNCLAHVVAAGLERHVGLAERQLQFCARHPLQSIRGQAFVALYKDEPAARFEQTVRHFISSSLNFLDETACARIAEVGLKPGHWQGLTLGLASLRQELAAACTPQQQQFAVVLLRALARIPNYRWSFFLPVTCELTAWLVVPVPQAIRNVAEDLVDDLRLRFRESLGSVQTTASDPRTGREYTWGETLRFENGIDQDELERIAGAIQHTKLVREAVYLFYDRRLIDLQDLSPGSVWVSLLATRYGRSVYRVTLRLRGGERCDFALLVQGNAPEERFRTGLRLMGIVGDQPGEPALVARFGGYWPEHRLATAEFIGSEPLDDLVGPMHDHPDREVRQRLKESCRHVVWSALTAAFDFHRRTQRQWIFTDTLHRHVSVPLNDYEPGIRLLSVAGARPFKSCLDTILRFKHEFLDLIRFKYPALASDTTNELIFDAALESLGQEQGLAFLNRAIAEAAQVEAPAEESADLRRGMEAYIERIGATAYLPKSVRCAVARYRVWAQQVPKAAPHARAAQLRELQVSYGIDAAAGKFPGARLQLYAATVLKDVPADARRTIEHSVRRLRQGDDLKQVLGRLYADLQPALDSHDLRYCLSRAAYPHLDLDEKAELVTITQVGTDRLELVTQHLDKTGRRLWIRPVANSREVDVLHRVFFLGGLGGGYSTNDQLLAVVDEADCVIGGVSYVRRTPTHAFLDKIAVLHRFRGHGIGRLLLNEFSRRLKADGVHIISAQFIRRDLLEQFGFKSNPRYAGVVLPLAE